MTSPPPFRVALTGGIASGKSTVAHLFAELGVPLIDTDVIAREVVAPGQPALAAIVRAFGPEVLDAAGQPRPPPLRERIFADPAAQHLEAILHPAIRAEMERRRAWPAGPTRSSSFRCWPKAGAATTWTACWWWTAGGAAARAPGVAGRRLARAGPASLNAQATRAERLAIADDVIENSGGVDDLAQQVHALHEHYLQFATAGQS